MVSASLPANCTLHEAQVKWHASATQFARYIPLQAGMIGPLLPLALTMVMVLPAGIKHPSYWICLLVVVMCVNYLILDAIIAGIPLMGPPCVSYDLSRIELAARCFRTLTPWVADLVLLVRLYLVFPPKITNARTLIWVFAFPIGVKVMRILMIIWCLNTHVIYENVPNMMVAEYVLQLFDNAYCVGVAYWRLRKLQRPVYGEVYRTAKCYSRLERVLQITLTTFAVPLIMNLLLIIAAANCFVADNQSGTWQAAQQYFYRLNVDLTAFNVLLSTTLLAPRRNLGPFTPPCAHHSHSHEEGSSLRLRKHVTISMAEDDVEKPPASPASSRPPTGPRTDLDTSGSMHVVWLQQQECSGEQR